MCRFRPQQENRLPNCCQAFAIIWQFILNIRRKWQLLIRFERRLAVYFHCFLPVEVKLFIALHFHAISTPVGWFKVKFCQFIYFKNASTLPWELAFFHLYTLCTILWQYRWTFLRRIALRKSSFFQSSVVNQCYKRQVKAAKQTYMFVHCIPVHTSKLK